MKISELKLPIVIEDLKAVKGGAIDPNIPLEIITDDCVF